MKRFLLFCLKALITIVALVAALFAYFVYTPAPELPQLSGKLTRSSIEIGGLKRTYTSYVPEHLAKGAPLVIVMHGAGESGARIRAETGYGFDILADQHGFLLVYPNAYEGFWNTCNVVGDVSANGRPIDDVGFLSQMADKLVAELGVDPDRVFAVGSSRGGFMAIRLALEAPARFRAVAAVSANVPTPDNFKCKPTGQGTSSIMIMNGTDDPVVPFDGGEVSVFGFYKIGTARPSRESGQYFADLNNIAGAPDMRETQLAEGVRIEQFLWHNDARVEVELLAIHGAGHGIPQPYRRRPRLLGPSPTAPNGPEVIWAFFARQRQ